MIGVDASVAVKWFAAEAESATALALFRSGTVLMRPDHALGEIGEVLVRRYRRGSMTADEVRAANDAIAERLALRSLLPLIGLATTIAFDASVSFYDARYVAAAERWYGPLVMADARLVAAITPRPWQSRVVLLRDWRDADRP